MSQSQSFSCKGGMDHEVEESFSKVSISQFHLIREDSSVSLPSLAQIVFGSICSPARQANGEGQVREKLDIDKDDFCQKNSRKRQASNKLQRQAALQIDDESMKDQQCFGFVIQESISVLPLRTLLLAKSLIKAYANQATAMTNLKQRQRKISLFACLLLAALELKGLNIQELQGEAQQIIFSFGEKQMVKYITNLIEQINKAIELNKQNRECIWLELELKIRDPDNKMLRRKFLSLTKFQASYDVQSQQSLLCTGIRVEEIHSTQKFNDEEETKNVNMSNKEQIKQQIIQNGSVSENSFDILSKAICERADKDVSIATEGFLTDIQISLSEITQRQEDSELFKSSCISGMLEVESKIDISTLFSSYFARLIYHCYFSQIEQWRSYSLSQTSQIIDYSVQFDLTQELQILAPNDLILSKISCNILNHFYKNTKKDIDKSDKILNATQGYLTQIQISFVGASQRKQNGQILKSSCISDFQYGESIVNVSCNIWLCLFIHIMQSLFKSIDFQKIECFLNLSFI